MSGQRNDQVTRCVFTLALAMCGFAHPLLADSFDLQIARGWDMRLAAAVQPSGKSGVFTMDYNRIDSDAQTAVGRTFTWAELNPADGVYDFTTLRAFLSEARSRDLRAVLRLKGLVTRRRRLRTPPGVYEGPYVPAWVLEKHRPPEFITLDRGGLYLRVAAPWDRGLHGEYLKFVERFGEERLLADSALAGLYIHGFSSSEGEEFWLGRFDGYIDGAEAAGMTEVTLVDTFRERLRAWANAAGTNVSKLAWVGAGPIQSRRWNMVPLDDTAMELGMGQRHGGIENYHVCWYPTLGQSVSNGYMVTDWKHPLRDGRYFGDEGERNDIWKSEPVAVRRHCVRSMVFAAAQMGMNHLWMSEATYRDDPEVWRWFSRVAGKGPMESPDAICWLREDRVVRLSHGPQLLILKNFERFLYQRDFPGGFTSVPCLEQKRPALPGDMPGHHYDFAGRRSDVARGERSMLFFVDRRFAASTDEGTVRVLVTYHDAGNASWQLLIASADGVLQSGVIHNKGDGGIWTASAVVPGIAMESGLPHGAILEVRVVGGGDLSLQCVRVVREDAYAN